LSHFCHGALIFGRESPGSDKPPKHLNPLQDKALRYQRVSAGTAVTKFESRCGYQITLILQAIPLHMTFDHLTEPAMPSVDDSLRTIMSQVMMHQRNRQRQKVRRNRQPPPSRRSRLVRLNGGGLRGKYFSRLLGPAKTWKLIQDIRHRRPLGRPSGLKHNTEFRFRIRPFGAPVERRVRVKPLRWHPREGRT